MAQSLALPAQESVGSRRVAIGLWAVFITYFTATFFANAINIAQPIQVAELNGMDLFSWIIALPALGAAVATLMFGKLSDVYGRRAILLTSLTLFLVGTVFSALSTTIGGAIIARVILMLGQGAIAPLCFSVIGDLFEPAVRARWSGMLNLPAGITATIAPTLGGVITESSMGWRGLFWIMAPLVLISGGLVAAGIPGRKQTGEQKVDFLGIIVMVIASASLIVGVTWLGDPDRVGVGVGLVAVSVIAWTGFIAIENRTEAPILDPQVLFNRTFITAAGASFIGIFGFLGVMIYGPVFAQEVMQVSPTVSGSILTPFTMLMAFMGIPAGFLLARTKKYKWMYVAGFAILGVAMFIMSRFNTDTPIWLFVVTTSLFGFANGILPTVNILVAQFAAPKHLLGVAIGAMFFVVLMGIAIAPAILGLAQNTAADLESGLRTIFLVGAIGMAISLVMVLTIPEVSIDAVAEDPPAPPEATK